MSAHSLAGPPDRPCSHERLAPGHAATGRYRGQEHDAPWLRRRLDEHEPEREDAVLATCCIPGFQLACARIAAIRYTQLVQQNLDLDQCKPVVKAAMKTVGTQPDIGQLKAIHAYTDGSFAATGPSRLSAAGWATAIIGQDWDDNYHFYGWMAASLEHDRDLVDANGPLSNNVAECLAIIWTMIWALSLNPGIELAVHSDSQYAIDIAVGGPTHETNALVTKVLSGITLATRARNNLSFHHVHSHEMHPWNELADDLANHAAIHDWRCSAPTVTTILGMIDASEVVTTGPTEWLFLAFADKMTNKAYPDLVGNLLMVTKPGPAKFPDEIFRPAVPPSRPLQALKKSELTIATFNAMTLTYDKAKTQHDGLLQPRKLHAPQRQFAEKGADIVAVQESRSPTQSTFATTNYVCVSAQQPPAPGRAGANCG